MGLGPGSTMAPVMKAAVSSGAQGTCFSREIKAVFYSLSRTATQCGGPILVFFSCHMVYASQYPGHILLHTIPSFSPVRIGTGPEVIKRDFLFHFDLPQGVSKVHSVGDAGACAGGAGKQTRCGGVSGCSCSADFICCSGFCRLLPSAIKACFIIHFHRV